MSTTSLLSQNSDRLDHARAAWSRFRSPSNRTSVLANVSLLLLAIVAGAGVIGCGDGGYPGGGITSLSASSIVLDAGQSFGVTAKLSGNMNVSWTLSGSSCSGDACGTISSSVGTSTTYTAPAGISGQMKTTLTAAITNTKSSDTVSITVNPDPTISGVPPAGVVGAAYTTTFVVAGGTAPLTLSLASGSLPPGLTFNAATRVISGTPTTPGTYSFTVQLVDSSDVPYTVSAPETITVTSPPLSLTMGSLPNGTVGVPYTATIGVSGGISPYSCTITAGMLPAGLSLGAGCVVNGTPTTAGTSTVTVRATDSSNPVETTAGPETITIVPAALSLTMSALPNGTVGVPYNATIGVGGGTSPYSCSITAGTLPAGLSLGAGCVVSGTPTTAGTSTVTVKATDSSNPVETTTGPETITIAPAPLTLTMSTLPNGTVGVPYSATIGVSGGTSPYSCSITSGTLPAGLILGSGCVVSGTPTTAETSTVTVKVTDSSNPVETTTGPETITIAPAPLTLTMSTLPNGTVGVPYSATIGVNGGTSPYSCSITSGTLPAGLTISGCTVSGTPTTAGTATVTVKVTDSSSPANTTSGPETITITSSGSVLTVGTLPGGTVGVPYNSTIPVTGGTSPYSCTITSGALPAGLGMSGCTVSGTPTTAGTSTVTVKVTDSSNPNKTTTATETITIGGVGALSLTGTLPNAILGVFYTHTLSATGGTTPYTYSLTVGSLPPGISLAADGVISGTPTAVGDFSFTVTVTDSSSPEQTASLPLTLLVVYPTTPNDSELKGPYAFLFQGYDDVVSGVLAFQTATVGSFTADGTGVISAGELDSNHQSSNPAGTTVSTSSFVGTYQINSDNRGLMTITMLNPDGTVAQTSTYAISLQAPVSPSTISTQGDLIEFDSDQAVGTRGSGTLLAQTTSTFAAGLNGSYAFGMSGDTPCLISCTIGIASGPVATVGAFTANGSGDISTGTADANIATFNFASAPLTGSYEPADQNGRAQLTLVNTSIFDGLYPEDYAVYIVNANQVFLMSTDKHSAYTLLAGSAQLQTQSTFDNTSMNGAFIGYENAQSDPGLLGTTLQNVLNYSSATIFRATGDASGTCTTTDVDSAGLTSLVDNLTGIANKTTLLQALLGEYEATGNSSCTVSSIGRGVLDYPLPPSAISTLLETLGLPTGPPAPRVFYLVSPNKGYFLETGYAGLGNFEPQTGSPFSLATLDGTYVEGTIPASSLASINTSGHFTANGNGQANYTLDENVGVGTINVLQVGTTASTTYSLSDPNNNPATTGRYLLGDGTTVLYAISPDRFVVLNTNPLTTSPGVSVLSK
jgi:hypothetical protein